MKNKLMGVPDQSKPRIKITVAAGVAISCQNDR